MYWFTNYRFYILVSCNMQYRAVLMCRTRVSTWRQIIRVFWISPAQAWMDKVMLARPSVDLRRRMEHWTTQQRPLTDQCRQAPRRWTTTASSASRRRGQRAPSWATETALVRCPRCHPTLDRTPSRPNSTSRRPRTTTSSRNRSKICHWRRLALQQLRQLDRLQRQDTIRCHGRRCCGTTVKKQRCTDCHTSLAALDSSPEGHLSISLLQIILFGGGGFIRHDRWYPIIIKFSLKQRA